MELGKAVFEKEVSSGIVLVNFGDPHCKACIKLNPTIEELSKLYNNVKFAKLDVDEEIAAKFNILGLPCLILFNKGKEIARIVGAYPKEKIKERIDSILKSMVL